MIEGFRIGFGVWGLVVGVTDQARSHEGQSFFLERNQLFPKVEGLSYKCYRSYWSFNEHSTSATVCDVTAVPEFPLARPRVTPSPESYKRLTPARERGSSPFRRGSLMVGAQCRGPPSSFVFCSHLHMVARWAWG